MEITEKEYRQLRDSHEQLNAILRMTDGMAVSQNKVCELLRKGRGKVRSLLGVQIRLLENESNMYGYNLSDVLRIIGKQV